MGFGRKIRTIFFKVCSGNKEKVKKIYCQLLQVSILDRARMCQDGVTINTMVVDKIKGTHCLLGRNRD